MQNWKTDRIGSCERGENPTLMLKLKSGFAVIGDSQYLPGYCVLLGYPKAASLNELPLDLRSQFLLDMSLIGDAITASCKPLRVNYSVLMNADHYLHAHIHARYAWEREEFVKRPTWVYPKDVYFAKEYNYNEEKYGNVKQSITENLLKLTNNLQY